MSSVQAGQSRLHVFVVTFPAFGHLIPTLELAKKISKHHDVTFAISSSKIPELTSRELVTPDDAIQLYAIPDGVVEGFDNMGDPATFYGIFKAVQASVTKLLLEIPINHEAGTDVKFTKPVDVVILETFVAEPVGVCRARGVPVYVFQTANCVMTQLLLLLDEKCPTVPDAEAVVFSRIPEPGVPPQPKSEMMVCILLPIRNVVPLAAGIIINSFRDIELDVVKAFMEYPIMAGVTVHCVGPLISTEKKGTSAVQLATESSVLRWLDRRSQQNDSRVVFVSFGSVAMPSPEQIKIIGQALLASGRPFIFSLREKHNRSLPEEITNQLAGQLDRPDSPFLVLDWAPQKLILSHLHVAVFLSHCGWNSTLEAVASGTPIVAWPLFGDQLLNAEWMTKLGAGVVIPDTGINQPRTVPVEEINAAIALVGGFESDGNDVVSSYSTAAETWSRKIQSAWSPDGSSHKEFMDLMAQIRETKLKSEE